MNPTAIIQKAAADGVNLVLSPTGTIKATGEPTAVNHWHPIIREHKAGIASMLQKANSELESLLLRCACHYQCSPGEIEEMQEAASRDPVNALICFRSISKSLAEGKNG